MPDIEKIATNSEKVIIKERNLDVTLLKGDPHWLDLVATGHIPEEFETFKVVCELRKECDVSRNLVLLNKANGKKYVVQGFGFIRMEDGRMVASAPDVSQNLNAYRDRLGKPEMGTWYYRKDGTEDQVINNSPLGGITYSHLLHKIENSEIALKLLSEYAECPKWIAHGTYDSLYWDNGDGVPEVLGWGVFEISDFLLFADVVFSFNVGRLDYEHYYEGTFNMFRALAILHKNNKVHAQPHGGNIGFREADLQAVIKDYDTMYDVSEYPKHITEFQGRHSDGAPYQNALAQDLGLAFKVIYDTAGGSINESNVDRYIKPAILGYLSVFLEELNIRGENIYPEIEFYNTIFDNYVRDSGHGRPNIQAGITFMSQAIVLSLFPIELMGGIAYHQNLRQVLHLDGSGFVQGPKTNLCRYLASILRQLIPRSDPGGDKLDYKKVGRNEPCPCGSGKKYKHCHGRR